MSAACQHGSIPSGNIFPRILHQSFSVNLKKYEYSACGKAKGSKIGNNKWVSDNLIKLDHLDIILKKWLKYHKSIDSK